MRLGFSQERCDLARSRRDPEAFDPFYRRFSPKVLKYFRGKVASPQVALDLTAEVFAKAYEARRSFRGRSEGESASWVFTIAERELANYLRRQYVERDAVDRLGIQAGTLPADDGVERVEALLSSAQAGPDIQRALERLPADQQEVIRMRVLDDMDHQEIAASLGVSHDVVRARVSRGLRTLAQHPVVRRRAEELDV